MNKTFWEDRYSNDQTQWDAGAITTPIKDYVDQLVNKDIKILIPGAGNAHEAVYLWNLGFRNVYVLDFVEKPLLNLKKKLPDFPNENLILCDFFNYHNTFDLIIEQTFFCALNPVLRPEYALKINSLLREKGKLVGLLFDFPLTQEGPPFGGDFHSYHTLFNSIFVIKKMEKCYNSIKPRLGKEYFIMLEK